MSTQLSVEMDRYRVVLVEPQDGGNVGAVCRGMKNMGFTRLAIVGRRPEYFDENRIRTLALHAWDIYEQATFCDTLDDALEGTVIAAGVTRRRGKFRKYFSFLPEQLVDHINTIGAGDVALVFGRESSGLTDDELAHCNVAVRIPSSEAFPSLNLSHAVQIITYSLSRSLNPGKHTYRAIHRDRLLEVQQTIVDSFEAISFFKQNEKEEVGRFFTDILSRASLSEREAARLEKMFRKMAALKIHRPH